MYRSAQDTPGTSVGPIEQVREGMVVRDSNGTELGHVELVRMGDPDAVTGLRDDQPERLRAPHEALTQVFGGEEPKLPDEHAHQLLRIGFVKIDSQGVFNRDAYASADQIERVDGDVVHLAVDQRELRP